MSNKDERKKEKELARQRAKQEAEDAKQLRKLVAAAKKEEEAAAKVKARMDAQAAKERSKHEVEESKKAKVAAAIAKKEEKAAAKVRVREEAEEVKRAKVAAAAAKKEEKAAAKIRAREEAEESKKARVAAAAAKKEEKAAAKTRAHEEAEAAKNAREAALFAKKQEEASAKEMVKQEVAEVSKVSDGTNRNESRENRKAYSMVPLFSWRSLLVLVLGVMVGAGMGLAYWIVSPSFSSESDVPTTGPGSLAKMVGQDSDVPWTSKVNVQIVNPGTSYTALRDLQSTGEYYAAKTSSLPFLQFLSEELDKNAPEYYHTVDVLDQMITAGYKYGSEQPAIEISVTAETAQEATFLTASIPEIFKNYLISEEMDKQDQEYEGTVNQIDFVKGAIVEAEYELNVIKQGANENSVINDPAYVALSAKIEALENELNRQAMAMALNVVDGNSDSANETIEIQYDDTLQEMAVVSAALAVAENQLKALELQYAADGSTDDDADHVVLNAKVRALEQELNKLMAGDADSTGLATMIAQGVTYTQSYKDTMTRVNRTSLALVEARNEISDLESQADVDTAMATDVEYQLAAAKVANLNLELSTLTQKLALLSSADTTVESKAGTEEAFNRVSSALAEAKLQRYVLEQENADENRIEKNLDYLFAQAKVDNLNQELARLTQRLTSMLGNNSSLSTVSDYLVAGNPSIPLPELPERMRIRNALIMGALLGIAISWIALNFRWIGRVLSTNSETEEKTGATD